MVACRLLAVESLAIATDEFSSNVQWPTKSEERWVPVTERRDRPPDAFTSPSTREPPVTREIRPPPPGPPKP